MGLVDEALKQENERLRRENEQLKMRQVATAPAAAPANGSQPTTDVVTTITLKPGCKITIEYP